MKCLHPVWSSLKSLCFLEVSHSNLAQVTWTFFLVMRPIRSLTCSTTVSYRSTRCTRAGTWLITSWICTSSAFFLVTTPIGHLTTAAAIVRLGAGTTGTSTRLLACRIRTRFECCCHDSRRSHGKNDVLFVVKEGEEKSMAKMDRSLGRLVCIFRQNLLPSVAFLSPFVT